MKYGNAASQDPLTVARNRTIETCGSASEVIQGLPMWYRSHHPGLVGTQESARPGSLTCKETSAMDPCTWVGTSSIARGAAQRRDEPPLGSTL
jgi:hypothetical protein